MPARKRKKLSQSEQSARFREAAREAEVDESGKTFERALKRVVPRSKAVPKK